jgi:peptide/nickel transport system substrate-binding protein
MKILRLAVMALALLTLSGAGVRAQTTLRIGLAEDPDILDPSLAAPMSAASFSRRSATSCSTSTRSSTSCRSWRCPRDLRRRQGSDDQAAARRQIPGRRTARRRSREILDRAPHEHADLVPQAGTCQRRSCRRGRSPDHQARTQDAVLAIDRPAHRSRRHDDLAQGGVKEEGDKFGLHPVCAGPYKFVERVQQDRMVFEKFADYWNKDNVFIDRIVVFCQSSMPRCGSPI